jgi:carotenoid cleavage dioxygenase-like enzyme
MKSFQWKDIVGAAMSGDASQYLSGNFAPISMECEARHLPVQGQLPRALRGTLYRNGPNPQFAPDPSRHHWFLGDGMIHAFEIEDGRCAYRNRWVRTPKWLAEDAAGRALEGTFDPRDDGGVANTNIVWHAGRLLALEEAHLPIELDPRSLATRGAQRFGDALGGPFTAHPKTDPKTGELVFFAYSADGPFSPRMRYGTIDGTGRVTRFELFDAPYCSMVHDFAVTEQHVLFPVLPLTGSLERARTSGLPFAWEPGLGGHIGVVRRDQGVSSLRWFRAESCYVFHVLNAWEEDGKLFADVMQYDAPPLFPRADGGPPAKAPARLVRWSLDLADNTDAIVRTPLDDLPGEFPRIDDRVAGLKNRFGAIAASTGPEDRSNAIAWFDLARGARAQFTLPRGDATSEPVFVPRTPDAAEGDGWLLAVVWRGEERRSDLIVLDTQRIERGPVATVQLAHRVPFGFHGNFVTAAAMT